VAWQYLNSKVWLFVINVCIEFGSYYASNLGHITQSEDSEIHFVASAPLGTQHAVHTKNANSCGKLFGYNGCAGISVGVCSLKCV